jgi:glycosyltransferase involved in cell wall biosynthesis
MNTSSPLVSICLPTYNRPEYLRRAVVSCLAQTYKNFELIITDNSTNDESAAVAAKFNDPRISYYKNEGNIGPYGSMVRGISLATGKYRKHLMDDDLLKPRCLELSVAAFETNPSVGLVMAPMELIDNDDRRILPKFYVFRTMHYRYRYQVGDGLVDSRKILKDYLTRDYPCCVPSGIMFRDQALEQVLPLDRDADFAGDVDACMGIAANWDFYYIDEVLSAWRYSPESETARFHQTGIKVEVFYHITRKCLKKAKVQAIFKDDWSKIERDSIFFCSCRAMLNGPAAIRARKPQILWNTFKVMWREDKYLLNYLRLPFFVFREIWVSLFPPKLPPARE